MKRYIESALTFEFTCFIQVILNRTKMAVCSEHLNSLFSGKGL